jgi:urea transport system permease protein
VIAVDVMSRILGRTRRSQRFGPLAAPSPLSLGIVLVVAIVLPLVGSDYIVGLVALYLPLVLVALAADILWGLNGIISFGHAVFFAAGAYVAALVLKGGRQASGLALIGGDGGAADPSAPFWVALRDVKVLGVPVLALLVPAVAVGIAGVVLGLVLFRLQSPEVYIPLLTLGLSVIATLVLSGWTYLGSSNGINNVPALLPATAPAPGATGEYVFNLVIVAVVLALYALFRRSRAGKTWLASGDDPIRLAAQGVPVGIVRGVGFGVSAALAGLGGALFVSTSGFIAPDQAGVLESAAVLIWVAVGGPGNFWGPLIGVMAISFGQRLLTGVVGDGWQLVLGLILILVVLLLPNGLQSLPTRIVDVVRRRRRPNGRQDTADESAAA